MSFEVQMGEAMTVMEVDAAVVENEADILSRYTLAMPLFVRLLFHPQFSHAITQNFLLVTLPHNDGPSILFTALTALYQMTYVGFFVHLNDIISVLRLCKR